MAEISDISWDVVLFSETRAPSGKQVLEGGHVLYTHLDTNMFAGVGILLHSKHVKKSNRIRKVSDRVLGLDVIVNAIKITVVAVYMPHCGYSVECFEDTYEQLRCILQQVTNMRRRLVIGGDFNTQVNVGSRGLALQNLVEAFSLRIANHSDADWDKQWTFRSNMGIKRKIDFVLVSKMIDIQTANASMEVDLGSDHRAVRVLLRLFSWLK